MNFIEEIKNYKPYNEQEENDKKIMLEYIEKFEDVLTRENKVGHFTVSAWVVNKSRTKVLMIYHNIYDSWAWVGGHADGEEDLLKVAVREIEEETSVKNVKLIGDGIYSLEIVPAYGHIKRGKYVSSHLHLNLTYLIEADENETLHIREEENSGVAWIKIEDIKNKSKEDWFKEKIYSKIIEKMNK